MTLLEDASPAERTPIVTIALLAANVLAFGWQVLGAGLEASIGRGAAIPFEILTFQDVEWRALVPPPFTIFTSMFLHVGLTHLGMNLLTLWLFGSAVEDALGRLRFLGFYLAAGVAAALAQALAAAASGDVLVRIVGASGAIAGVLAGYLVLFPRGRVLRLPAGFLIGCWFLVQIAAVVLGGDPGVAFVAHVGGFLAGLLLARIVGRRARRRGAGPAGGQG